MSIEVFLSLAASQQFWVYWTHGLSPSIMTYEELIALSESDIDLIQKIHLEDDEIDTFRALIGAIVAAIKKLQTYPEQLQDRLISHEPVVAIPGEEDIPTFGTYGDVKALMEAGISFIRFYYKEGEYDNLTTIGWIIRETLSEDLVLHDLACLGMMIERDGSKLSFTQAFHDAHRKIFPEVNFDRFKDRVFASRRTKTLENPTPSEPSTAPKPAVVSVEERRRQLAQAAEARMARRAKQPLAEQPTETEKTFLAENPPESKASKENPIPSEPSTAPKPALVDLEERRKLVAQAAEAIMARKAEQPLAEQPTETEKTFLAENRPESKASKENPIPSEPSTAPKPALVDLEERRKQVAQAAEAIMARKAEQPKETASESKPSKKNQLSEEELEELRVRRVRFFTSQAKGPERAAEKPQNPSRKKRTLLFLLGGFLTTTLSFGLITGIMTIYGSASAMGAVLSALPFLGFLAPLTPLFATLAFAALVTAAVLLIYGGIVSLIHLSSKPKSKPDSTMSQDKLAPPPQASSVVTLEPQAHHPSPVVKSPLDPRSEDHSCNVAPTP
ncbi:MAG: hypothetical protein Q8M94_06280 [Ignavibacteria bacterium]|nr:hypothetical protein [Ignavibacteria bacterium]